MLRRLFTFYALAYPNPQREQGTGRVTFRRRFGAESARVQSLADTAGWDACYINASHERHRRAMLHLRWRSLHSLGLGLDAHVDRGLDRIQELVEPERFVENGIAREAGAA